MRGRLTLAGLRPSTTPVGDFIDASWAAVCDLAGPGEHLDDLWFALTGDATTPGAQRPRATVDGQASAPSTGDRATVNTVEHLSDDDLAKWVPAYSKPDYSDEDFDSFWRHTAQFAAGQSALIDLAGGAAGTTAPAAPAASDFGAAFGAPTGGE